MNYIYSIRGMCNAYMERIGFQIFIKDPAIDVTVPMPEMYATHVDATNALATILNDKGQS